MENGRYSVSAAELREWLENGEPVFILDLRPMDQRQEWQIPGSFHLDAYKPLNEGDSSILNDIGLPKNRKVVTVCAGGRISQTAAMALRENGFDSYSLEGGMKAWSTAWNLARRKFEKFEIIQLRRTGKGCLSYLVSSNQESVIIDASLPVEVYEKVIKENGLTPKYVIETHIHADHLSRSKEIAERFNVPLYLPVPNKVQFFFKGIIADSVFNLGFINLRAISTPGHTLESVSFYIDDLVLFSGDTLFTNGVGRPDLKASEEETVRKSKLLYQSLRKIMGLPDQVIILPAHTNKPVEFDGVMISSNVGAVKKNIPLISESQDKFAKFLLHHIPPTPANYLSIVEINLRGSISDGISNDLEAGANRCAIS